MRRQHCIAVITDELTELRYTPFRTLIELDSRYVRGMLAGLLHAGAITTDEFKRLNDLASNAYTVRSNELFDLAMARAAA